MRAPNLSMVKTISWIVSGENRKKKGFKSSLYMLFYLAAQNYNNPAFKMGCTLEKYYQYKKQPLSPPILILILDYFYENMV